MKTVYFVKIVTAFIVATATLCLLSNSSPCLAETSPEVVTTEEIAVEIKRVLKEEEPYEYHKRLSTSPVHTPRRNPDTQPTPDEMVLTAQGWTLVWHQGGSAVIQGAVLDFQDYLKTSMGVEVTLEGRDSLENEQAPRQSIVVGTRDQLSGYGATLKAPKDYEILVTPERITVCGYDERGAMYGLYHLEARMNLREAPYLPANLNTVRHSLYDTRMVQSWMGWMEFPDTLLAHLAHDGFDALFASVYTNPNGDRTTAENSTDFYARLMRRIRRQDPARVRDLIDRAKRFGIKVYTPIIYQYVGTPESEADLRRLVREILAEFPDIQGYVLLTEGFWYKAWGGGHGASKEYIEDWARNWSYAVGVVAEECHRMLLSNQAILTFEDLRLQLVAEGDSEKAYAILDRMEGIVREEIARTERALLAVTRDSRIGFQYECDYVYTPYSLREKLRVLRETVEEHMPTYREGLVGRHEPESCRAILSQQVRARGVGVT